ncbi:MAG: NADH-quinone oxidoreductase subunit NuoE [Thermodesulfovibrionales bacterium]|nr:NADH-quinone oxidoreductase subunit NuoE [Thermodesulfovibrionales bacterium]
MKIEELENIDVDSKIGRVGEVLTEKQKKRGLLIYAFQQIQKEYNYLPEEALNALSKNLGIPLSDVYSTASFYRHFYFKPRGKNIVSVCTGTACHVRGAGKVLDALKEKFGIGEGETTEDMFLTLETVGCVGCCGLAPVLTVNEEVVGEVTPKKLGKAIDKTKRG